SDKDIENDDDPDQATQSNQCMVFNGAADAQNKPCERRELFSVKHARKNLLELWHNPNHQHRQNDHRHGHNGTRIKHRRDHFAFDLLGLFHEFGQATQYHFQHAAQFTGFDHVDKKPIEYFGVLRQAFGESATPFNGKSQLGNDFLQVRVSFLLFEHAQAAKQW